MNHHLPGPAGLSPRANGNADAAGATDATSALTAGALDNLLRYLLDGCGHSGRRASILLDRLAVAPGTGCDLGRICERMSRRLEDH